MKHILHVTKDWLFVMLMAGVLYMAGCGKIKKTEKEEDHAAKFIGRWTGSGGCGGGAIDFVAGKDKNTISYSLYIGRGFKTGIGPCEQKVTITGNADGNTITFPPGVFNDRCLESYTIEGTATIADTTLTFILYIANTTCAFSGTKK